MSLHTSPSRVSFLLHSRTKESHRPKIFPLFHHAFKFPAVFLNFSAAGPLGLYSMIQLPLKSIRAFSVCFSWATSDPKWTAGRERGWWKTTGTCMDFWGNTVWLDTVSLRVLIPFVKEQSLICWRCVISWNPFLLRHETPKVEIQTECMSSTSASINKISAHSSICDCMWPWNMFC